MQALTGLKVIDLSRVLGGPYCTQILGDHGAEVTKVEGPDGDETRTWGPPFQDGVASYFAGINRNKQAIYVDLSCPQGRDVLLRLLEDADVLVENFKTGTLEKWGIGFRDVLAPRFPRLIHCRITGFGDSGPLGGLSGYDAAVQGLSGLMSVNGAQGDPPLRMGVPIVDIATGLNATVGILLALAERTRSGRGQQIEATLYDSALSVLYPHSINALFSGRPGTQSGNAHPNIAPYDSFATRTEPIFIAVGNNRQFTRMCEAIGRPELPVDDRFATNGSRTLHRDVLKQEVESAFRNFDAQQLFALLTSCEVPCGVIHNTLEALEHPHTAHRGMVASIGAHKSVASPIKLDRTPASYRTAPQKVGQSTRKVLNAAGYGQDEIDGLLATGAVRQAEA